MAKEIDIYQPKHPVRFVTASSLFDGHDVSINIMRRIMQSTGAEVIHLGHNRSVEEIVQVAIQEDVQGIAVSSYQGGHVEYFKYIVDLLKENNASHIKVFGGGGGTIIPREVKELHDYGVDWIFTPEDGRKMGLQGMINRMLEISDFKQPIHLEEDMNRLFESNNQAIARMITFVERESEDTNEKEKVLEKVRKNANRNTPVLGITGTGGAGKSSLTDELIRRFLNETKDKKVAIISIDPTKRKTGGALLGDRIRMNAIFSNRVFMRSLATRDSRTEISKATKEIIDVLRASNYDLIIVETSGIGQGDAEITEITDLSMYVMTAEYGAPTQLEKIDMIDFADFIVINKFEQRGSDDALNQVRKQYERSRMLFHEDVNTFPVFGTIASQFNDPGVNKLFSAIITKINEKYNWNEETNLEHVKTSERQTIIPNENIHYLREISMTVRNYHKRVEKQSEIARNLYKLYGTKQLIEDEETKNRINQTIDQYEELLESRERNLLESWDEMKEKYAKDTFTFQVRDRSIEVEITTTSLAGLKIPKVKYPNFKD